MIVLVVEITPPEVIVVGVVVSGLYVGIDVIRTLLDAVSGILLEVVIVTLLDVVTAYVITVVCTGQLVTSGGQSVTVTVLVVEITPPEAIVVGAIVPLLIGYGTLVTDVELEAPPEAPVEYRDELEL